MKTMYTINLKKSTCKYFILFMNISYLLSISQLSEIGLIEWIDNLLIIFGIINIFLHYLFSKTVMKKKQLLILIIVIALGFLTLFIGGGPTLLKFILFAVAIKDVKKEDVLKYSFISLIVGMLIVLFAALFGITELMYFGGKQAYTLGFGNPNNAPMVMVGVISIYNIIHEKEISIKVILAEGIITALMYILCRSRTATIVLVISLCLLLINRKIKNKKIISTFMVIGQWFFFIFAGISYYIAYAYQTSKGIWGKLDLLLSWRPYLWNKYFDAYEIGLFGAQLDFSTKGALDNAYLNLLYRYGIIIFFLYAYIFLWMSKYAVKNNFRILLIYIISYEIYFMFEYGPLLINVNSVLLVFLSIFVNSDAVDFNEIQTGEDNGKRIVVNNSSGI